jgi:magnesium-transporting ATPase (P-type)
MKSPGPDNLAGILSWKRPLRTSQRLPETSSSAQRSSFPDGDELPVISTTRSRVTEVPRRSGATARGRAIGLHSLTFGTGIAQRNLNHDLEVEGIPFDRECDDLARHLRTTMTEGLAETETQVRRKEYGDNILKDQEKPTVFKVLWRQVSNAMTVILVAAMIIAVAIDDDAEGGFIAGTGPPSSPSFSA